MLSSPSRYRSHWPDEHADYLRSLWDDGYSASQIAGMINRAYRTSYSRCAIIGKVHRLNLPGRSTENRTFAARQATPWAKRKHRPSERKRKPRPKVKQMPPEPPVCPDAKMLSIMELSDRTCKWPIGDPKETGFGFCGADKEADGTPYCAFHNDMGTRPLKQTPWTAEMKASRRRAMAERGGTTPSSWCSFKPDPAKEPA